LYVNIYLPRNNCGADTGGGRLESDKRMFSVWSDSVCGQSPKKAAYTIRRTVPGNLEQWGDQQKEYEGFYLFRGERPGRVKRVSAWFWLEVISKLRIKS